MPALLSAVLFLALSFGCAPARPVVFVDISSIESAPARSKPQAIAAAGGSVGPEEATLSDQPARPTVSADFAKRREQARNEILGERKRIVDELSAYYQQDLERALKAMRAELTEAIKDQNKKFYDAFAEQFSQLVKESAALRAPRTIRFILLQIAIADEHGKVRSIPLSKPLEKSLKAERETVKHELSEIDARYDGRIAELLANHLERNSDATSKIEQKLAAERSALDARIKEQISSRLGANTGISLPEALEESIGKQNAARAEHMQIGGINISPFTAISKPRMNLLHSDLERAVHIWAEVHGYKLVSKRKGAVDKTAEFRNWLKKN